MIAFIYKFAAAILQPLRGGPIINCLDIISKSIIYVFAALSDCITYVLFKYNSYCCSWKFNNDDEVGGSVM